MHLKPRYALSSKINQSLSSEEPNFNDFSQMQSSNTELINLLTEPSLETISTQLENIAEDGSSSDSSSNLSTQLSVLEPPNLEINSIQLSEIGGDTANHTSGTQKSGLGDEPNFDISFNQPLDAVREWSNEIGKTDEKLDRYQAEEVNV